MITAERKPMEELIECVKPYRRILLVGCNECVTVCAAGGRKEVGLLSSALQMAFLKEGKVLEIEEITLERQCDPEYVEELIRHIDQADAVLSMACGCGVQEVARRFKEKPVFPAVNTKFMGASERQGVWAERCQGCGDCRAGSDRRASAPSPAAPNGCSTVRAVVPPTASAKSARTSTAPGSSFGTG